MIPSFLKEKETVSHTRPSNRRNFNFVDRTAKNMAAFMLTSMRQWNASRRAGLLQGLDARVKVVFVIVYIILVSLTHKVEFQLMLSGLFFLLFLASKINPLSVYLKITGLAFFFGFIVFIPATLNLFAPGEIIFLIAQFEKERTWLVYHIPKEIGVTREGLLLVARISLKVFNSISLTFLLTSTTGFEQILKALKMLKVPDIFLLTLSLSYQYIFIFSQTILETYQALKMRWWERGARAETNAILSGRMGYLFRKSWEKYDQVYHSMVARGYTGEISLYHPGALRLRDYLFLSIAALLFAACLFFFL